MKKLLTAVALAVCAVLGANAATLNVDAANGPFKTIQAAIDESSAGDRILVAPGTYDAIDTQGKDITILSTDGAEKTIIVGTTVKGLGADEMAVVARLMSDADYGTDVVRGHDISDVWVTWTPEDIPGSTLEGFTIAVTGVPSSTSHDDIYFGVLGGRVKNCRFEDYPSRLSRYAHVRLSVVENSLIVAGQVDDDTESVCDSLLRNCTVYTKAALIVQMENTIVYGRGGVVDMWEDENTSFANCVFYPRVKSEAGKTYAPVADPLFVDAANGDFRLQAGSPCIDKGGTAYGYTDLALDPRICNGKVDIGCYEYQTSSVIAWPEWAIGTWAGRVANYVPDEGETYEGLYKLTLSATGTQEEYVFDDDEVVKNDDAWIDVKVTGQSDCHLALSFWYWSGSRTQKFDANMVLRKEGCDHYATSSYSSKIAGGDTVDVKELTKLEMNTAPADGWPEWVIGTWRGEILNYVPDKRVTYKGTYTLTVSATGTTEKYVFEDGDVINHNDDLRGWGITDKADCHVVGTCWCWNDEKDDWFDAKFVFRNTACSHYAKSSGSSIMHTGDSAGKDTCEVADLKKFELATSYGPFVPGEKVELDLPALVGWTAKGLPSGLKFNTKTGAVTGAAKKPTAEEGAIVTFTKKGAATLTTRFIVGPIPTVAVTLAGDTNKCSVAGAGKAYLAGKKVTLTAKAPKGTAFLGWTTADGEPWPDADATAKLSFTMPAEDVALVATFEKEKMSLACPTLEGGSFTVGVAGDAAKGLPLEIETQSGVKSVKASKLPSGMKLVKDKATGDWSIVGTPTKAGDYEVVLTVTAVSGATETVTVPVTVEPLPAWAVGTFTGVCGIEGEEEDEEAVYATLTVAANGKLSGKVLYDTGEDRFATAAVSAKSMTGRDGDVFFYDVVLPFKDGKTVVSKECRVCVSARSYDGSESADAEGESAKVGSLCFVFDDGGSWTTPVAQNVWKVKSFTDKPVFAAKKTTVTKVMPIHGDEDVLEGTVTLDLGISPNGSVAPTLVIEGKDLDGEFYGKLAARKTDLVVMNHMTSEDGGTERYVAQVPLVIDKKGLRGFGRAVVELPVSADGLIHEEDCVITDCTDAGDWSEE